MKNAKTIADLNILKSHDYYNASHEIINAYAYINDKGIIPAGSPYPYYNLDNVNNIRYADLKTSYFPIHDRNVGSTFFLGDNAKIRFINFSQMTRSISNIPNTLDSNYEALEIKVQSPPTPHASGQGQIDLFTNLETVVPEGTTVTISYDIQINTTNANYTAGYVGFVEPFNQNIISPDWEGNAPYFDDWVQIGTQPDLLTIIRESRTITTTGDQNKFFMQFRFTYDDECDISIKLGRLKMEVGNTATPFVPAPSDGGSAPTPDGIPEGIVFHDIDAEDNVKRYRADVIMINGKILESRLPVPITTEQKLALKMKGIQVL